MLRNKGRRGAADVFFWDSSENDDSLDDDDSSAIDSSDQAMEDTSYSVRTRHPPRQIPRTSKMSQHSTFGSPSPGSSRRTSRHITTEGLTISSEQATQSRPSMEDVGRRGSTAPIPDTGDSAALPLSASMVLPVRPKANRQALAEIEALDDRKGILLD
ncbi:hypothetical protein McanCB49686_007065 [Microsporum canis]